MFEHEKEWTDKKREIVLVAIELMAQDGFHAVSTAKIARQAAVAEGTIFRHFQNKDQLINIAAHSAAARITLNILKTYRAELPFREQFFSFISEFLRAGVKDRLCIRYLEKFVDSAYGHAYRREMLKEIARNPEEARPFFYPLNVILVRAKSAGLLKPLPLPLLAGVTLGQLFFVLGDVMAREYTMDDQLVSTISEICWDAIRVNEDKTECKDIAGDKI